MSLEWVFLVGIGGAVLWMLFARYYKHKRFTDREDFSEETIYNQFFAPNNLPKDFVLELWREVANILELPAGKLRPSDRFDKELGPAKGWEFDDEIAGINWAVERRLKKLGAKANPSEIQTLGDYIEFFCELERGKEIGHNGDMGES